MTWGFVLRSATCTGSATFPTASPVSGLPSPGVRMRRSPAGTAGGVTTWTDDHQLSSSEHGCRQQTDHVELLLIEQLQRLQCALLQQLIVRQHGCFFRDVDEIER